MTEEYFKPEHQASQSFEIEVDQATFKIFEEIYYNNSITIESRSEMLQKMMRSYLGAYKTKSERRKAPVISDESHLLLEDMNRRKRNQTRRVFRQVGFTGSDLDMDTKVLRFEILMAIAHMKNVSPEVKGSFKELKKYISSEFKGSPDLSAYQSIVTKKYRDKFSEATLDNIRSMVRSQAEDYGLTKYFFNYFNQKDSNSEIKFIRQFSDQIRYLKKKKFIKDEEGYLVPDRNYIEEMSIDLFGTTMENLYKFSFHSLAKFLEILESTFEKEDEIVLRIRKYFGSLENDII